MPTMIPFVRPCPSTKKAMMAKKVAAPAMAAEAAATETNSVTVVDYSQRKMLTKSSVRPHSPRGRKRRLPSQSPRSSSPQSWTKTKFLKESRQEETAPPKGSIAFIRMKDFMSYKNSEVKLGRGFNVVVGPNGSGKSSIVSAIGLLLSAIFRT